MNKIFIFAILLINTITYSQNIFSEKTNTKVVEKMLKKVYSEDRKYKNPLNDTLLFSKEIIKLNNRCDSLTEVSIKQIAKSDSPSDKPILREGSYVSSIYEGATNFTIDELKTNDNTIEVVVTLSNKLYKDQKPWKEKIIFIHENGLKIDNIFFDKNLYNFSENESTLKKRLINFFDINYHFLTE